MAIMIRLMGNRKMTVDIKKMILIEARQLIEKGWTQGTNARKIDGTPTTVDDPEAVCFCAIGAIMRAEYDVRHLDYFVDILERLKRHHERYDPSISSWNDNRNRTKTQVIALFDKAIKGDGR